jgi:RNA polymerase sigma factor for flagellar operon FliA
MAGRFKQSFVGAEFDDLVSVGRVTVIKVMLGLKEQLERPEIEIYMRTKIRGAIIDAVRKVMPISRRSAQLRRRYMEAVDAFEAMTGQPASDAAIASFLMVPLKRLLEIKIAITPRKFVSFVNDAAGVRSDDSFDGDGVDRRIEEEATYAVDGGRATPRSGIEEEETREELLQMVSGLPQIERAVIEGVVLQGQTAAVVGAGLGCSVAYVYQVRDKALQKLRRRIESRGDLVAA